MLLFSYLYIDDGMFVVILGKSSIKSIWLLNLLYISLYVSSSFSPDKLIFVAKIGLE